MIDLHSHVLPGIDDGASDLAESLAMLSDSFTQGVRLVAATPHCTVHRASDIPRFLEKRENARALVETARDQENTPRLICGAEIFYDNDLSENEDLPKLCLEGTPYLLCEFAFRHREPKISEWFYSLNLRGIVPLVAHVERYDYREQLFSDLAGLRVAYSVNASIFLSMSGRRGFRRIVDRVGRVVVASDMHNTDDRKPLFGKAYAVAKKKFPHAADDLFSGYARELLRNAGADVPDNG